MTRRSGSPERQRPQQHRVDDAEDRGVGADAEREREDGGRGEAGILAQHAHGVDEVLAQRVERTAARADRGSALSSPRGRRARAARARRASSGVMPARRLSSMCSCRWLSSSAASSRSCAAPPKTPASRSSQARSDLMTAARRAAQEPREDRRRPLPVARFLLELLPAGAGEAVELRLAVVVGDAPFGRDVAFLLELEQRGVERAVVERRGGGRWSARCGARCRSRAAARASRASSAPSAPACPARRQLCQPSRSSPIASAPSPSYG